MSAVAIAVPSAFPVRAVPFYVQRGFLPHLFLWLVTLTLGVALAVIHVMPSRAPAHASLKMSVHEQNGQLRIAWKPSTAGELQILDGDWSTTIPIPRQLSGITYARRTSEISVLLIAGREQDTAHFVSREAATPAELIKQMRVLADQARLARVQTEGELWHVRRLQRIADRMMATLAVVHERPLSKPEPDARNRTTMTYFWR